MFGRLATFLTIHLLRGVRLTIQDRTALTNVLLDKLQAFPSKDVLTIGENGRLVVGEREVDIDVARKLRQGADAALENSALKVIRDQIAVRAIAMGIHNGDTPEKLFFGRAALWYHQQLDELLKLLATEGTE